MLATIALTLLLGSTPAPYTATIGALAFGKLTEAQASQLAGRMVRFRCRGVVNTLPWTFRGWTGYEVDGLDPNTITRTVWLEQTAPEIQADEEVILEGRQEVIKHPGWTWQDGMPAPGFTELRVKGKLVSRQRR